MATSEQRESMARRMECSDITRALAETISCFEPTRYTSSRAKMIRNALAVEILRLERKATIQVLEGPDESSSIMVGIEIELVNGGTLDWYAFLSPPAPQEELDE